MIVIYTPPATIMTDHTFPSSIPNCTQEYFEFMNYVHDNGHNINISTITLLCALNVDKIDIKTFSSNFAREGVTIRQANEASDYKVSKRGKVKKNFFNQVTLNYEDISKKSIKIFSNGKLQMTGLSSFVECNHVANMVLGWIIDTLSLSNIHMQNMYIGMINSNFSVYKSIDLHKLTNILNKMENVMSIYNPESYPAINMKYITATIKVSIFIFGTGNIVITGGKSLNDMKYAYKFIVDTLNINSFVFKPQLNIKKKRPEPIIDGYPIRQYQSCCFEL